MSGWGNPGRREEAISCNPELFGERERPEVGSVFRTYRSKKLRRAALEQGTARNVQGEDLSQYWESRWAGDLGSSDLL